MLGDGRLSGRDGRRVNVPGAVRADKAVGEDDDEDGEYAYGDSVDEAALLMGGSTGMVGETGAADDGKGDNDGSMVLLGGGMLPSAPVAEVDEGSARADNEASDDDDEDAGKVGGVLAGEAECGGVE